MALKQRLVVVGTGSIGRRHARLLAKRKDITVELCDSNPQSIDEALKETGMLRQHQSFDLMLESKPDIVLIASPHHYHTEQTLRSLQAGAHVLCEKPMSDRLDTANEVLLTAKRYDRVLVYGFSNHFHPGVLKIKEKLESGQLGEVLYIHFHVGTYGTLMNSRSRYQANTEAALLMDYVHQPDLLYWLLGEIPKGVYAAGSLGGKLELMSNPNSMTMILDYQGPLTASIHLNYLQYPDRSHYELLGDQGWIFYDLNANIIYFGDRNKATVDQEEINFDRDSIYEAEHQAFFDTISEKRSAESSAEDAFQSMMVVEAAIQSWKTKQRVALEQVCLRH
ncbi:MAG: Gfo/Idh/MocA family oxidoreductase [Cyclobacteriaceae bacterium]|nr:Gfo/Idh/MocA family oxidoreductase [Cyclobacteriaceae bacterium]